MGGGRWIIQKCTPSVGFSSRGNSNYSDAPRTSLMGGVELAVIVDTVQAEAQFRAKHAVWCEYSAEVVPVPDILAVKKNLKDTRIDLGWQSAGGPTISVNCRERNPFRDKRVRQALPMLLVRDTSIEVFGDLKNFGAAGVEMVG